MRFDTVLRTTFPVVTAILTTILAAPAAHAQYMYLDSNGDGIHSAADVITATGTTTFDIWLRTNTNRDGSAATCVTDDGPLTINSYVVCLKAAGGTITWGVTANLQPTMGLRYADRGNSTEYAIAYLGGTILPPGNYRLAQISAMVDSGSPSIEIVPSVSLLLYDRTSYGTGCGGIDFDNTSVLGQEWSDADGLAYSSGGSTNSRPILSPPAPMTAATGETAYRDVAAADPDGDIIGLNLTGGPSFLTLTELTQSPGASSGRIHASPLRGAAGSYHADLSAADGGGATTVPFDLTVTDGGDHPPQIVPTGQVDVLAGTVRRIPLQAVDSDGDPIQWGMVAGVPFASVQNGAAGRTARSASLVLQPTICDLGDWTLGLTANAGGQSSASATSIHVRTATPPAEVLVRSVQPLIGAILDGIVTSDFNRDGHADVAAIANARGSYLQVFLGDGHGMASPLAPQPLADYHLTEVGAGDWNGDGNTDLIAGGYGAINTWFLRGRGDGTFDEPVAVADAPGASDFRTADFDADGIDDLVAAAEATSAYVFKSDGSGGIRVSFRVPTQAVPKNVAVGDFNLDGRLDLAFSHLAPGRVSVALGRGDGTFGDLTSNPIAGGAVPLLEGDFDQDGRLDLVTSLFDDGRLYILRGDGAGGFTQTQVGVGPALSGDITGMDWNMDGKLDLFISGDDIHGAVLPGLGNGAFGTPIPTGLAFSGRAAVADFDEDGRIDLASSLSSLVIALNGTPAAAGVAARAFQRTQTRAIPLNGAARAICVRLEPVDGTFDLTSLEVSSIRLMSAGTGTTDAIAAINSKASTLSDTDGNGVPDLGVCFATPDMSALFADVRGRRDVTARLGGALRDGRRFCAPVTLTVVGGGASPSARVEPNPLNPEGMLRFTTRAPGAVSVRLFDVNGRLVRTLWNGRATPAGDQEVRIDGKDGGGGALRSGVYFYRVEGGGLGETGRFTILK